MKQKQHNLKVGDMLYAVDDSGKDGELGMIINIKYFKPTNTSAARVPPYETSALARDLQYSIQYSIEWYGINPIGPYDYYRTQTERFRKNYIKLQERTPTSPKKRIP